MNKYTEISKELSYALRHAPWQYGLEMDDEGWVPIVQLLDALHKNEKWKDLTEEDLNETIKKSNKKRHQIVGGKIRAYYGHSTPNKIVKIVNIPPKILYHGTSQNASSSIIKFGLLPMNRQYVHLSQDVETAFNVGLRHGKDPCMLKINAKKAWEDGIEFYYGNEKVWLAEKISNKYISILE